MPAFDIIHEAVKNALIKDGWIITADPFTLAFEEVSVFADLAAERAIAAERSGSKIAVEIKSFLGPSPMRDFEVAVGQYTIYRDFLIVIEPDRRLFMAVSDSTYSDVFALKAVQYIVRQNRLALLIIDIGREEIIEWISEPTTAQ